MRPAQQAKLERCEDGIGEVNFKPKKSRYSVNFRFRKLSFEQESCLTSSFNTIKFEEDQIKLKKIDFTARVPFLTKNAKIEMCAERSKIGIGASS